MRKNQTVKNIATCTCMFLVFCLKLHILYQYFQAPTIIGSIAGHVCIALQKCEYFLQKYRYRNNTVKVQQYCCRRRPFVIFSFVLEQLNCSLSHVFFCFFVLSLCFCFRYVAVCVMSACLLLMHLPHLHKHCLADAPELIN